MSIITQTPQITWKRQWGTNLGDFVSAITSGTDGSIYVSGFTYGNLDGQTNSGGHDAFISKYTPDGNKVWTRLLGGPGLEDIRQISASADGSIYVVGVASGHLDGQVNSGDDDGFITKYQSDGTKVWTRLIGSVGQDHAQSVSVGKDGFVYVSGNTNSLNLDGQTNHGGFDGFISKYNISGTKIWTRLLDGASDDMAHHIATSRDGAIYITGNTRSSFSGQQNNGDWDVQVSKYNSDGVKQWTTLLGSSNADYTGGIATGPDGSVYIVGDTWGNLGGQGSVGLNDVYLSKFNPDGSKAWTKQRGTTAMDFCSGVTVGEDGSVYISGSTEGGFDGQSSNGGRDAYVAKYNSEGDLLWTKPLDTGVWAHALGVTLGANGAVYVAGTTEGSLNGQTYNGNDDAFLVKLNDPSYAISSADLFSYISTQPYSGNLFHSVKGDFNKDGLSDIVYSQNPEKGIVLFLGKDGGGFSSGHLFFPNTAFFWGAITTDFNGDGNLDVIGADPTTGNVTLYKGDGHGGFNQNPVVLGNVEGALHVSSADYDNNGTSDLAVTSYSNSATVKLFYTDNASNITSAQTVNSHGYWTRAISHADFNQDGYLDLLVTNVNSTNAVVIYGPNFSTSTQLTTGKYPISAVAADFNADGKMDFATGNHTGKSISVFLNTGSSFTRSDFSTSDSPSDTIIASDFNNDGHIDIATSSGAVTLSDNKGIYLLLGDGTGNAFTYKFVASSQVGGGLVAIDQNQDGRLELISNGLTIFSSVPTLPVFNTAAFENSKSVTTIVPADALLGTAPKYALTGADASLFKISSKGVLTFATVKDYEQPVDSNRDGIYEVSVTLTNAKTGYRVVRDLTVGVEFVPINGTTGADTLKGTAGWDTLDGLAGDDKLTGGSGLDTFLISSGHDTILDFNLLTKDATGSEILQVSAGATADAMLKAAWIATADSFNDGTANLTTKGMVVDLSGITHGNGWNVTNAGAATTITGSQFDDVLIGGSGNDQLMGGAGNDVLIGGKGNDTLTGGTGTDTFRFGGDVKTDHINDFLSGTDRIELDHLLFKAFGTGQLAANQFGQGTAASTATQRLVYDQPTGNLWYDADGSGKVKAVLIGVLDNHAPVLPMDFWVI
jgi:Ca2+-binding RTX toxin-like protein